MTKSNNPNLQLIYVSDMERSTDFYKKTFNAEPTFSGPRYVVFSAGGDAYFALWSGADTEPDANVPRFSEIGIMLASDEEVENLCVEWKKDSTIKFAKEIHTAVFGRTFLVEDPDGHIIRVCSMD